jgi:hypothetical protein
MGSESGFFDVVTLLRDHMQCRLVAKSCAQRRFSMPCPAFSTLKSSSETAAVVFARFLVISPHPLGFSAFGKMRLLLDSILF